MPERAADARGFAANRTIADDAESLAAQRIGDIHELRVARHSRLSCERIVRCRPWANASIEPMVYSAIGVE